MPRPRESTRTGVQNHKRFSRLKKIPDGLLNGGLIVLPSAFVAVHRQLIFEQAAQHRLPAVYGFRYFAADGGLMSYGVDVRDLFRRSAAYVDGILKGAKPGELPVQAPTKFQLVVNLKTAKALDLTLPPTLLASADEFIE